MLVRLVLAAPEAAKLVKVSEIPAVKLAVTLVVLAIGAPKATVVALLTVAVEAEPMTTWEAAVTKAAVT